MLSRQADAAELLAFFAGRFDMKAARNDELEFLSCASESATHDALSLSEQVAGIAGLISSDRDRAAPGAGCLQDDDQAALLWKVAREIEVIGRMIEISSEADFELRKRTARATADTHFQHSSKQSSSDKGCA